MDKIGKLRILIKLALIDGYLDQSEKNFLSRLAALEYISEDEVEKLVAEERASREELPLEMKLPYDEKIAVLTDLIRVMKVDGKVFDAEVKFCERVAKTFGFTEKSIGFLSGNVNTDLKNSVDLAKIHYRMKKYVTGKDL